MDLEPALFPSPIRHGQSRRLGQKSSGRNLFNHVDSIILSQPPDDDDLTADLHRKKRSVGLIIQIIQNQNHVCVDISSENDC